VVLLLLLGTVVGYVVSLARRAERAYAQAVQLQAATAERERLSASVHDGVLQAARAGLPPDHRPELAGLAAEQEAALRRLVSNAAPSLEVEAAAGGETDLRSLLPSGADLHLAAPADPCCSLHRWPGSWPPATAAAVDNARRHGGGEAWLLVEDEPEAVTVTVRDAGPGIAPGRLEQAARDGRLGVAQSIRGRVADLGGRVDVVSDGQGTEVELHVPRPR
jgi:hypothetical protein